MGFYTDNLIIEDTPNGDLMSFIMVTGLGKHFKLNSYRI